MALDQLRAVFHVGYYLYKDPQQVLFPKDTRYATYDTVDQLRERAAEFCQRSDLPAECVRVETLEVDGQAASVTVPAVVVTPAALAAFPRENVQRFVVLFKGNLEDLGDGVRPTRASYYAELAYAFGAPVLVPEYPGYGCATGAASEDSVNRVARAAYEWGAKEWPNASVFLAGRSIGCGPAVQLCFELLRSRPGQPSRVAGLLTLAGWSSVQHLRPLLRRRLPSWWNSAERAPSLAVPWCIVHGSADKLIPYRCAESLHQASPLGVLVTVHDQGHNSDLLFAAAYLAARRLGRLGDPAPPSDDTSQQGAETYVYCPGFNNTADELAQGADALRASLSTHLPTGSTQPPPNVVVVAWYSAAGDAKQQLVQSGTRAPTVAGVLASPGYSTDSHSAHAILVPAGRVCILAHSHGCRIVLDWLRDHPGRWPDVERIVFAHPDVSLATLAHEHAITASGPHRSTAAAVPTSMSDLANGIQADVEVAKELGTLLKDKLAVFDAARDYATTTAALLEGSGRVLTSRAPSGASRALGPSAAVHVSATTSMEHALWLREEGHRRAMTAWLATGRLPATLPANAVTKQHPY